MTPEQINERARRAKNALEFMGAEIETIRISIHADLEADSTDVHDAAAELRALRRIENKLKAAVREPEHQKSIKPK